MVHRIEDIKALPNFIIEARFFGGEIKQYDVTNLFDQFPQFCIFKSNPSLFEQVQVDVGGYGISWNDELDLDADVIWDNGVLMEIYKETNIRDYQLSDMLELFVNQICEIKYVTIAL